MNDAPSDTTPIDETARRRPTAHDVARLAGVSQSAVSRTFTPGASVSDDTRERVHAAAKTLGYRPNLIARSLIMRRSNIVGVAVPDLANPFYPSVLQALSGALTASGYRILLFTAHASGSSDPILEEVLRYRLDALILVSATLSSGFADECRQTGLPVVLLNRTTARPTVSSVTGDNHTGACAIARFLLAGAHCRYAFVAGLESSSTSHDREAAFTATLDAAGQELAAREVANFSFDDAQRATRALLRAPTPPDAIFCANDYMAIAALTTARDEFGMTPGVDISIVGFDDIQLASAFALTTYRQPAKEMAERAVAIIDAQLHDAGQAAVQEIVPGTLAVRGSARLPPQGLA
ncbi:MAG: LacI family DNA-binding transcriptional regulator [Janthinobacterium lividum]